MDNHTPINKLSGKSRERFLKEQDILIRNVMDTLIAFRLDPSEKYKEETRNFFKNIGLKALALGYQNLTNSSQQYEKYIETIVEVTDDCHEFFSNVLKGVGIIQKQIEILKINLEKEKTYTIKATVNNNIKLNNKGNILILDDDRLTLSILRDAFEGEGYDVNITTNPYEAIDKALGGNIDIILIDIIMPKLNGFEVFEILKKNQIDIPIIFLTGRSLTDYKVDALSKGADDYITKPFEIKEVIARVERALMRSHQYKSKLNVDKLTGTYTKEFFNKKIEELRKNSEFTHELSVAFMDMDNFKLVNDTYGHIVGDYILRDFSQFVKKYIGQGNLVFRFGGDEFIILFIDKNEKDAFEFVENLREKLNAVNFKYEDIDDEIKVSISIGVTYITEQDSIERILNRADKCLYKSKELGKNRTICSNNMNSIERHNNGVIIIESESDMTNIVKGRLKYIGYEVNVLDDMKNFEKLINQLLPNLIILNFTKNIISSIKICKEIKNYINTKGIKVMVILPEDKELTTEECLQLGIHGYIVAPFSEIELEKKVNLLLSYN